MKTNILLIALMLITTVAFTQTKDESKQGLRKIASGNGSKQINEEVEREVAKAMDELRIELKDIDVKVNLEVLRALEGIDEEIAESLEGLDVEINENIQESLRGIDVDVNESINEVLRDLDHLDLDLDIDIDSDRDEFDNDRDPSIERFRKEALRDDKEKPAPKKEPKKKD